MSYKKKRSAKKVVEIQNDDSTLEKFNIFTESKTQRLSLQMLVRRHLPSTAETWDQEEIFNKLNAVTHIRLDRENIRDIDSMELLGDKVTNLYLQQNKISHITSLDCLVNLRFLTLSGNYIKTVENIQNLNKLLVLDLSDNNITHFDMGEFPKSLIMLDLSGNPGTRMPDYRQTIVEALARLQQLDGVEVSQEERKSAGHQLSSEDDSDEIDDEIQPVRRRMLREHEVDESIGMLTSAVLLRSQDRLEESLAGHRRHNMILADFRLKNSKPCGSRASSASSRTISASPIEVSAGSRTVSASSRTNFISSRANFTSSRANFPGARTNFPGPITNFPGSRDNFPGSRDNFPGSRDNFNNSASSRTSPASHASSRNNSASSRTNPAGSRINTASSRTNSASSRTNSAGSRTSSAGSRTNPASSRTLSTSSRNNSAGSRENLTSTRAKSTTSSPGQDF